MRTSRCDIIHGSIVLLILLQSAAYGQSEQLSLDVNDPRPVSAALLELMSRHPVIVTYEDPRYEYLDDIQDVTDQVRDPRNPNNAGKGPVLVPRGGLLAIVYGASADTKEPLDLQDTLSRLLAVKNAYPTGGRFAVLRTGDIYHVVPTQIRDANGVWIPQTSILDVSISISTAELEGTELMSAILDEVGRASGANILGIANTQFIPTFSRYRGRIEANNEPARMVLLRALHGISERFTWLLNYDPSGEYYVFAIAMVAAKPPPPDAELNAEPEEGPPPFLRRQ
jgi:hypothetical protein